MGDRIGEYPYLVVRAMPAVYLRYPIDFLQNSSSDLSSDALLLLESEPFDREGKLTTDCRKKLIEAVCFGSRESGLRMCIVFGSDEAVYVEPDGTASENSDPPHGGAGIDLPNTTF